VNGLTVRWSLSGLGERVLDELAAYVADTSFERFSGMDGLRFKTWRARPGEWFEGCYVFEDATARARFQDEFTLTADISPGSRIVGAPPVSIEACRIVAVAEGAAGFEPVSGRQAAT
jgi:hypothetical protein